MQRTYQKLVPEHVTIICSKKYLVTAFGANARPCSPPPVFNCPKFGTNVHTRVANIRNHASDMLRTMSFQSCMQTSSKHCLEQCSGQRTGASVRRTCKQFFPRTLSMHEQSPPIHTATVQEDIIVQQSDHVFAGYRP